MQVLKSETLPLLADEQVVAVRQSVRNLAIAAGLSLVEQTKIITAASELARNTIIHGKGGHVVMELLANGSRKGVRLTFEDSGPGINNIEQAMTDGFTTNKGMGLGLGGAKRLSNEFTINSKVGQGTRVSIARWK